MAKGLVLDKSEKKPLVFHVMSYVIHKPTPKYCLNLQTSTHALMFIVHHLEFVRLSALMKLAVCVMKTVLPIMTQCALRMGQHMTTNAGMSSTTVED